jgi:hypothetical protein
MRWFVEISPIGNLPASLQAPISHSFVVEARAWQGALKAARELRGEIGPISGFSIELLPDAYRAVDPATRCRFLVRRAPDDTPLTSYEEGTVPPRRPSLAPSTLHYGKSVPPPSVGPSSSPPIPGPPLAPRASSPPPRPSSPPNRISHPPPSAGARTQEFNPSELVQRQQGAQVNYRPNAYLERLDSGEIPKPTIPGMAAATPIPPPVVESPDPVADVSDVHELVQEQVEAAQAALEPSAVDPPEQAPAAPTHEAEVHLVPNKGNLITSAQPAEPEEPSLVPQPENILQAMAAMREDHAKPPPPPPEPQDELPVADRFILREENPTPQTPLTYREYAYCVPEGTVDDLAAEVLFSKFQFIKQELDAYPPGKFVNLAIFDCKFVGRPPKPPLATLSWKDWRGPEPELRFPMRERAIAPVLPAPSVPPEAPKKEPAPLRPDFSQTLNVTTGPNTHLPKTTLSAGVSDTPPAPAKQNVVLEPHTRRSTGPIAAPITLVKPPEPSTISAELIEEPQKSPAGQVTHASVHDAVQAALEGNRIPNQRVDFSKTLQSNHGMKSQLAEKAQDFSKTLQSVAGLAELKMGPGGMSKTLTSFGNKNAEAVKAGPQITEQEHRPSTPPPPDPEQPEENKAEDKPAALISPFATTIRTLSPLIPPKIEAAKPDSDAASDVAGMAIDVEEQPMVSEEQVSEAEGAQVLKSQGPSSVPQIEVGEDEISVEVVVTSTFFDGDPTEDRTENRTEDTTDSPPASQAPLLAAPILSIDSNAPPRRVSHAPQALVGPVAQEDVLPNTEPPSEQVEAVLSSAVVGSSPATRLSGVDLLGDLFEAMHELHFMNDALVGGQFVLTLAVSKLPSRMAFAFFYDINRKEFVLSRGIGEKAETLLLSRLSVRDVVIAETMRRRRAWVVRDVKKDTRFQQGFWSKLPEPIENFIAAPVAMGTRYLGMIVILNSKDENGYIDTDGFALAYIGEQYADFLSQRGVVLDEEIIRSFETHGS